MTAHRLVWDSYLYWQAEDDRLLRRINTLIRDIARHGNASIGKPEALPPGARGYWSRRITSEHRLVYEVTADEIRIAQCRPLRVKTQTNRIWHSFLSAPRRLPGASHQRV